MADRPAAPAFNVTRNMRLLYAFSFVIALQPHLAIWVVYLTDFRDLTLAQVGLLETFFWGISLLAEIPTGAFSDRFGRRVAFVAAVTIEATGIALFAFVGNYLALLGAYVLWSLGMALRSGNDSAYLYELLSGEGRGDDFPRVYGRLFAVGAAATALGGLGGSMIAGALTLQWAFIFGQGRVEGELLSHELGHVTQYNWLGGWFDAVYVPGQAFEVVTGVRNPMEGWADFLADTSQPSASE